MGDILEDFCEAWQILDSRLIIRNLSKEFAHDSQWVFESLDYNGYKEYIQGKSETI